MDAAVYAAAYLVAVIGGHFVVRGVLRLCPLPDAGGRPGLQRAGAVIGVLERIFTVTLVLLGQYSAVAIVFAAKSIVRFGEARERRFAEYYLVGTLSSILVAVLVAALAVRAARSGCPRLW